MPLNRGLPTSGAVFVTTTLPSFLQGALLNPIQMRNKETSVISIHSALVLLHYCLVM